MCNENSFEPYIAISIIQTPSTTQTRFNKDLLRTLISVKMKNYLGEPAPRTFCLFEDAVSLRYKTK